MRGFRTEYSSLAKEAEVAFRELDVALAQHFSVGLASPAVAHAITAVEKLVDEKLAPVNSNPYVRATVESVKGYCRDEIIKRLRPSLHTETERIRPNS
ncbi:hypothetical protein [Pararhizobium sp. PWRC1-1]|uniref:hypothetical protein n=1 Tax=Pararhizobium sp. PWRC1-1 TaxID=2804566 RepID=UPI003CF9A284